jgi:hypothetical protein
MPARSIPRATTNSCLHFCVTGAGPMHFPIPARHPDSPLLVSPHRSTVRRSVFVWVPRHPLKTIPQVLGLSCVRVQGGGVTNPIRYPRCLQRLPGTKAYIVEQPTNCCHGVQHTGTCEPSLESQSPSGVQWGSTTGLPGYGWDVIGGGI